MADGVALAIMCKAPVSGESKTRLCPPLDADEAAGLSACFIADVAASVARISADEGAHGYAVIAPADAEAAFADLLPEEVSILGQRGPDLSARLIHAMRDLLAAGHAAVCFINADGPTLPAELLAQATAALRQPGARIVLAPAIDGGYALLGLKRDDPSLFTDIAWSTSGVLAETLVRAARLRLPVSILPAWYDVDDRCGLELLCHELFGCGGSPLARRGMRGASAARTREYLEAILLADGGRRLPFPGMQANRRTTPAAHLSMSDRRNHVGRLNASAIPGTTGSRE